ncbi:MAG: hypothetical protein WCY16_03905 [Weeksellaceae bacterium]
MKRLIKLWILLYNESNWNKTQGDYVSVRYDRVKHGFVGDFLSAMVFILLGNWNNWGENLHFNGDTQWMFYYVLLPLLVAFFVGVGKELYDKKKTNLFDWGDVWATVLPFSLVYLVVNFLLHLLLPKMMEEITEEILR